ncbi:MAG: stage V sporulation protein AA [Clostridiales bacterium]|nr:stage V sporulation protein AA [Clostridiales bacterium]
MSEKKTNASVVYVKADLNIVVRDTKITLADIMKIYSSDKKLVKDIGSREILRIKEQKSTKYSVSILKVIEAIQKEYPDLLVISLGENDFVVEYVQPIKKKKWLEIIKAVFVGLAVFFGSAFSIMTFNQDVSVDEVLDLFHTLVMGESQKGMNVVPICYSIGLPIGIIIFFNHFSKVKMDSDPTPLQVQLRIYENDENKAIIENSSREGTTIDVD